MGLRFDPVRLRLALSQLVLWAGFLLGAASGWGYWSGRPDIVEASLFLAVAWTWVVLGVVLDVDVQVYGLVGLVDVNNWVLEMLARSLVYPEDRGWQVALMEWLEALDKVDGGETGG